MIKMMLMLLVAEGLDAGNWNLETSIKASSAAQRLGGSQVYLKTGESFPLSDYMHAVSVLSANDAALAVAEGLWGSEAAYLEAANTRAAELGMSSTVIRSPHGLTLGDNRDLTTAQDLSILARHCVSRPEVMAWVDHETFTFRKNGRERRSTNRLQFSMADCDGLKTGYTRAAGWCFTATAERNGVRLIAVVMGCRNVRERFNAAEQVLEEGFARMRHVRLLAAGQEVDPEVPVENAREDTVRLAVTQPIFAVIDTDSESDVRYLAELPSVLRAPLEAGAIVGTLKVQVDGLTLGSSPLAVPHKLESPAWPWKVRQSVIKRRPQNDADGLRGEYKIIGAD
jgi:D-alanyl-D-alanine carboxypeptidase (penicillin-binding protein 5/6)